MKKLAYVLYLLGFVLVFIPLLMTDILRGEIGDFNTKLLLTIGCVVVATGKAIIIHQKKEIGETFSTDVFIMVAFFALAGWNMIR